MSGDNRDTHSQERFEQDKKGLQWVGQVLDGREFYIVTYKYDKEYEIFRNGYAAEVFIWADDYTVFEIGLGDGPVLPNLDDPEYKTASKRVVPYTPELMKDRPIPETFINEQGKEVMRVIM